MSLKPSGYLPRLVDKKIERYLSIFGALSIEGPKWCGKTWTSLNHANSLFSLNDSQQLNLAKLDINYIFKEKNRPELIDEWNLLPETWDAVRNECDKTPNKGNFILTCSTKLSDEEQKEKIKHSGAGRIGRISMRTMSLFESGDSTGKVSISDMYNNKIISDVNDKISLEKIAYLIVRGGWPSNINAKQEDAGVLPKSYIENILETDMNDDKKRNKSKMKMILQSLARNESSISGKKIILKDIQESNKDSVESIITLDDYIDVLERLHIVKNQKAYSSNYRSPDRLGKLAKRHFVDQSLACACLDINQNKLINDIRTFGLMFESMVERDLEIYMDYLNGNIYHLRDNVTGLESDAILEFEDGEYAIVEIKLGANQIEEAEKNLIKVCKSMKKEPKFMCVIYGLGDIITKDKNTGIYVIPITALKP